MRQSGNGSTRDQRSGAARRGARLLLACALAALGSLAARSTDQGPVAIVVHPDTDISNLTSTELRGIFLADRQFWPDRSRITLLVRAPVAHERDVLLHRVYRMDEAQFRQYWIGKMFRAEVATGPKVVHSADMAKQLVTAIRGAITVIPATALSPDLKVVRIDGMLPTDPNYPLK